MTLLVQTRIGFNRFHKLIASILAITLLLATVFVWQAYADGPVKPDSKHILTVYDAGVKKGIYTDADNLGAALEAAGFNIEPNDITEPALDEPLVAANYDVNIYRARPVIVVDGTVRVKVMTAYQTPRQIAKSAGIKLYDEDDAKLSYTSTGSLEGALETMDIDRATAFTMVLYGKKTSMRSRMATVGEMLQEKNIKMAAKDHLSVKPSDKLVAGMKIELWRNGVQTITEDEAIAMPVKKIQDTDREFGYRKVTEAGAKGKKRVTYKITMKNGKEVSRKEISSVVIVKPKKQIEVVGAKIEGPETIIAKIRAAAKAKGIDAQRVLMIARCESGFNPRADSGFYKGIFQHDPNYWSARASRHGFAGASYYDVDAQIGVSTDMMASGGWHHWGCDPGPQ